MTEYSIKRDGGRIVLPGEGGTSSHRWVSTWGADAEAALQRFSKKMLRDRRLGIGEYIAVDIALVHRSDNNYNPNAISVAMPAALGGDVTQRHMGYLYDGYLHRVGMTNLPDLAGAGYGEVICTGILRDGPRLELDLPVGWVLGRAINAFLTEHESPDDPSPRAQARRQGDQSAQRKHTLPSPATNESLEQLHTFPDDWHPVGPLSIATTREGPRRPRLLQLSETASGRLVGAVRSGYLFLEDERHRPDVLAMLAEAEIQVAQPTTEPFTTADDSAAWPSLAIPNMWTYWFVEGLDLRPRDPRTAQSWTTIAYYNPTTKKLWVEDSRLVAPACMYAARIGVPVDEVGLPRTPWALETEIPYYELKDHYLKPKTQDDVVVAVQLLEEVGILVPEDFFSTDEVEWTSSPSTPKVVESDALFALHERHVRQRSTLFGSHQLTSAVADCRLCGQPGAEFVTAICIDLLTYCHPCLENATRGAIRARGRAAQAIQLLGSLEFGGTPMLEHQLDTLHIDPAEPVRGSDIDRLLLLRFAVARRQYPWTHLLEEAGFADDGLRTGRGTLIRSRDGHLCRSLGEKAVCDFLHQHQVKHQTEPRYVTDPDFNPRGLKRADWLLDDGTLVELWGMPNDPVYAAKMRQKQQLVTRHGLKLVELTDADLPHLPDVFAPWLPPGGTRITSWSWSPVVDSRIPTKRTPKDDTPGRQFNASARRERTDRCRRAVQLQESGLARRLIAAELGVSQETVKSLLRDGKFFAEPQTDPHRLRRARDAALAKEAGTTRTQFEDEYRWGAARAREAWRDADVVLGTQNAQAMESAPGWQIPNNPT